MKRLLIIATLCMLIIGTTGVGAVSAMLARPVKNNGRAIHEGSSPVRRWEISAWQGVRNYVGYLTIDYTTGHYVAIVDYTGSKEKYLPGHTLPIYLANKEYKGPHNVIPICYVTFHEPSRRAGTEGTLSTATLGLVRTYGDASTVVTPWNHPVLK